MSDIKGIKRAWALAVFMMVASVAAEAREIVVTVADEGGKPVSLVMVTVVAANPIQADGLVAPEETAFTDATGTARVSGPDEGIVSIRLRKPGFVDGQGKTAGGKIDLNLAAESDIKSLADATPANAWAAAIDFGDADLKQHFRLQCSFCHQQGTPNTMAERTPEEWEKIIDRMVRYGSRLHSSAQKELPRLLAAQHKKLVANPKLIPPVKPWEGHLSQTQITEWPLGDSSSQLHDVFVASSGLVYAGDNLQDNLIELNPKTNKSITHKIPKRDGDKLGGNIGGRLKNYPGVAYRRAFVFNRVGQQSLG